MEYVRSIAQRRRFDSSRLELRGDLIVDEGETLGLKARRKVEVRLNDERSVQRALCYAEAEMDGVRDLIP